MLRPASPVAILATFAFLNATSGVDSPSGATPVLAPTPNGIPVDNLTGICLLTKAYAVERIVAVIDDDV
jgi:hypothetical protein